MTHKIKAVLFDLDDTLFDHHHSMQAGIAAVQQGYARLQPLPIEEVEATYITLINKWHEKVLQGTLSLEASRAERFREFFAQYGERISLDEATRAAELYREVYQAKRQLIVGAEALLKHLRTLGVKIVIVTNNTVEEQHTKLKHLGITDLIDVLVISEEVGVPKPHKAIFEAALERSNCQCHEVVMVGDSWEYDIIGARNMGIRVVWLNRFGHAIPDAALALEINSLEPIEAIAALLMGGE